MPISASRAVALAGLAALALPALSPVLGQDRPESILPPGFGEPEPPTATPSARPSAPVVGGVAPPTIQPLPQQQPSITPSATPTATPTPIDPAVLAEYELPAFARRSLAVVGPVMPSQGGLSPTAFGTADGGYVEALMRRLDAPLPSRWMSILLRRALASRLYTPPAINGADFAAERGWLLLRMGEAVAARAVVQGVDNGNYTPKLYQVAMQTALANADPAGLCPLADTAVRAAPEPGWTMAQAMCAALSGDQARAGALIATARRRRTASGIDLLLAQKVVGAGAQGRQAVTIEWDGVVQLSTWRYGLATTTGVTIPAELTGTVGPQLVYWRALAPAVPLVDRLTAAEAAAGQGVLSSAALVDLYGLVDADEEAPNAAATTARTLRDAYVGATSADRMAAIRTLWSEADGLVAYPRLVMTARAAARIVPSAENADAARLVAAMLSAGLDRSAGRWRGQVEARDDAWAMLALADPDGGGRVGYRDLTNYAGGGENAALKRRMLFAGLAGLGRLGPDDIPRAAESLGVQIGVENAWTRALDRAAREDQPGTVVLLAAIGMQAAGWRGIPAEHLYRIVGALRAVGLTGEARMIAAESIARL